MLPCDADVCIGKKYYLLTLRSLSSLRHKSVQIKQTCQKRFDWRCWYLYEVEASEYDEETAKFFLDLHCRLTYKPLTIQPVWPLYIQAPFVIKHNSNPLVLCVKYASTAFNIISGTWRARSMSRSATVSLWTPGCNM